MFFSPIRPATVAMITALLTLAGCAASHHDTVGATPERALTTSASAVLPVTQESPPAVTACPSGISAGTRCLSGKDSAGAFYLIAIPAEWNGDLVLHAHGGPVLGAPKASRTVADLKRWQIMVRAGYAWAASSFHQGGVAVHSAAEDTERLRQIFVRYVGQPKMTILHGQSWGASVAAVEASMFTDNGHGKRPYDAVLLTSGVLAGGSKAYDFRLDLRVIYQYLCHNHPRPDEAQYPLWMGLPVDATLTAADLHSRVDACLGLDKPASARSAAQQQRIDTIVRTVQIPERSIEGHLKWATWHFQEIVQSRTHGGNPFSNIGAQYRGSPDDAALNRDVLRYQADRKAVAAFAADTDPDGRIPVPVLTVHAVNDPTAFVEMDDSFLHTMQKAGTSDHLVQTFTSDHEHSYLTDAAYPTLMAALTQWAKGGSKPTPAGIAQDCHRFEAVFGTNCHFLPDYHPKALGTRVTVRERR
jgi:hypothetical protein